MNRYQDMDDATARVFIWIFIAIFGSPTLVYTSTAWELFRGDEPIDAVIISEAYCEVDHDTCKVNVSYEYKGVKHKNTITIPDEDGQMMAPYNRNAPVLPSYDQYLDQKRHSISISTRKKSEDTLNIPDDDSLKRKILINPNNIREVADYALCKSAQFWAIFWGIPLALCILALFLKQMDLFVKRLWFSKNTGGEKFRASSSDTQTGH